MLNGQLYQRVMWAPATSATGGGALPISPDGKPYLPTPNAMVSQDGERPETWLARRERVKLTANNGNGMGMPLTIAAQLLPTPVAQTGQGGPKGLDGGSAARRMLAEAGFPRAAGAPTPLPTHTTRDHKDAGENVNFDRVADKGKLPGVVVRSTRSTQTGGPTYLNPYFVEEMMGYEVGWTDLRHLETQ